MNTIEQYTIESIIQPTHHMSDQHKCIAAIAYARSRNIPTDKVKSLIITRRLHWLDWKTITQRKWQSDTRNPNKARHNGSIALREKYVRC